MNIFKLCLLAIIMLAGCTKSGGGGVVADIRAGDEEAIAKCNHYRMCYQRDSYFTSTCMKWNLEWSKEGMAQLSKVQLLKKCYEDKDKLRDECFETDSEEIRLLIIEECRKIGVDPKRATDN